MSRQKLTQKLLDNLESEIHILKAITHRNIVGMEECFVSRAPHSLDGSRLGRSPGNRQSLQLTRLLQKSETHIYLVMEFCSGSDLSIYIKNRGRLPTLDYLPRAAGPDAEKVFWPHPTAGGIDEKVTRCFLGQLCELPSFRAFCKSLQLLQPWHCSSCDLRTSFTAISSLK